MPLKLSRYPRNWRAVADALKAAVDWRCQECDIECRRPGEPYRRGIEGWRRTLTVAHVEPESQAPDADVVCVQMLCGVCHARFDADKQSERQRRYRRRYQMTFGGLWARQVASPLAPAEVEELAALWPGMPDLEGGIDYFAEFPVVGEAL